MNIHNRYLMRASGEAQHQPQSESEAATFAVINWIKERDLWEDVFPPGSDINQTMESLQAQLERNLDNFRPFFNPIESPPTLWESLRNLCRDAWEYATNRRARRSFR